MKYTEVVNIRKQRSDIYIGRKNSEVHFGNPFYLTESALAKTKVDSLEEALKSFHDWLAGIAHQDIEPLRRKWIIENLDSLRGKSLGCFCKPKACHGDIYRVMLGEVSLDEVLKAVPKQEVPPVQEALF